MKNKGEITIMFPSDKRLDAIARLATAADSNAKAIAAVAEALRGATMQAHISNCNIKSAGTAINFQGVQDSTVMNSVVLHIPCEDELEEALEDLSTGDAKA